MKNLVVFFLMMLLGVTTIVHASGKKEIKQGEGVLSAPVDSFKVVSFDSVTTYNLSRIEQTTTLQEIVGEIVSKGYRLPGGVKGLNDFLEAKKLYTEFDEVKNLFTFIKLPYCITTEKLFTEISNLYDSKKLKNVVGIEWEHLSGQISIKFKGKPDPALNKIFSKTDLKYLNYKYCDITSPDEVPNLFKGKNGKLYVDYLGLDGNCYRRPNTEVFSTADVILYITKVEPTVQQIARK